MFRDLLLRERAAENDFWDRQDHIHEVIQAGQSHSPVHRHALLCDQYHDFTEEVRNPNSKLLPRSRKVMMPSQRSGIPRVCYSYDGSSTPETTPKARCFMVVSDSAGEADLTCTSLLR